MVEMTFEEVQDHLYTQLGLQAFPRVEHCSEDAARTRAWDSSSGWFIRPVSIHWRKTTVFLTGQWICLLG